MHEEIFVYYRIDAADEPGLRARVNRFQTELASRHPGLETRLLVRVGQEPENQRTLMEIYRRPGGVGEACQAAIAAAAAVLDPFLRSPRHTEVFRPCE